MKAACGTIVSAALCDMKGRRSSMSGKEEDSILVREDPVLAVTESRAAVFR